MPPPIRLLLGLALLTHPVSAQERPRSATCLYRYTGVTPVSAVNMIVMNNDGRWCGHRVISATQSESLTLGPRMHIVQPPMHGEVTIIVTPLGSDVLYRPRANYLGTDSFSVLNEARNTEKRYEVLVTR